MRAKVECAQHAIRDAQACAERYQEMTGWHFDRDRLDDWVLIGTGDLFGDTIAIPESRDGEILEAQIFSRQYGPGRLSFFLKNGTIAPENFIKLPRVFLCQDRIDAIDREFQGFKEAIERKK